MTNHFCKRLIALSIALFAFACSGLAQEFRATLAGRITDPGGAAIAGAKVTVKNLNTNEEINVITNDEGYYTVPFLVPSNYSVTVEATGFKRSVNERLELNVNDRRTLDLTLEVGPVEQTINVTSETPLLEADTATRGAVVENLRITELPLNAGRNPINFVNLSPGVQFSGNPQFFRPFDNGDNVQFSINGGLVRHNEYLIDGAPNNAVTDADLARTRSSNNIAFVPPADATQEFKVMTNTYDAQYGRTSGGIINVTTKSGGNEFHGTVFEFLRRYQLDANDTASNRAGRPRYAIEPGTGRNLGGRLLDDYGGTLTGPLWLPKPIFGPIGYDARNKTFFMFTFQGYRESAPSVGITNVPTALERAGDFSQSAFRIYDPLTTRLNPAFNPALPSSASNPQYIRDPFPGNRIPADRINPIGAAIVNSLPLPNFGTAGASFNNYLNSPALGTEKFRSYVARVDQNFGERERMFFRYVHNRRDQFGFGANALPVTSLGLDAQDPLVRINDGAVVDSVTTLSSRTLLDLRVAYTRFIQAAYRTRSSPFDATSIGFPASFSNARPVSIVPRFDIDQYYCCGSGNGFGPRNPSQNTTNILSFQPSVSHITGGHTFKFGGEVRDLRVNSRGASFSFGGGHFLFDRYFTRQFPDFGDTSGNAVAALLLGFPSNDNNGVDNLPQVAFRWGYYAGYIQDDWKVTPRLTLNLGLRYDYESAPTERYNQQNRGFAFDQASPLAAQIANRPGFSECPSCANLRGGLLFAGTGGQDRAAFDPDYNNIQPRAGAAFRLFEKTVLRGGYGLFYLPQAEFGGTTGYSVSTPVVAVTGGGLNAFIPTLSISNPFPNGLLQPVGSSLGLLTQAGTGIVFNLPTRRIPKTHQFSFGVQQQLPWTMRLDVAYAGSRSVDLLTGNFNIGGARNLNVLPAATIERARTDAAYNTFLNASVANPFAGLLPGTALNAPTIQRRQLLLPYPQFTSVQQGLENVGRIWYNSLQVALEKRLTSGLTFVSAYTWSKAIGALTFLNDQDAEPTRAVTDDDRTHRLVLSGVWQLPFGKGRRFAGGVGRAAELVIGGWEYTWIATIQTGRPLNLPGNVDLIGDISAGGQSFDRYFNTCVLPFGATQARQPNATNTGFETCSNPAFAIRGPNTLRTIPLRSSQVRLPSRPQFDMSLNKSFNFTETVRFQFRLESFNTFNTPIYGGPNTDPTSQTFGFITRNQANQPRNVQLGFKLIF
jgi:Carboxypeptidase regulatory-like domain